MDYNLFKLYIQKDYVSLGRFRQLNERESSALHSRNKPDNHVSKVASLIKTLLGKTEGGL